MTLMLRTTVKPASLAEPLRRAIREVAPAQPLTPLRPMTEMVADTGARARFTLTLLVFFATATLLLAAVGLYGLLAYTVARRTREIGLRVALGAQPAQVRGLVVTRGLALAAAGLAGGGLLAVWGARLLGGVLFEVEPFDPAVFVTVTTLVLAVAFIAAWVPARRASRIAPADALRMD
jgi:ABC-type antimicrobial peptide transport system permease subunit